MQFKRTALALVFLAIAGCGTSTGAAQQPPAPGYPVTVSNCGKDITVQRPPSRTVVMNGGSVAEVSTLVALGLGDRIVANSQSYGASDEPGRAEAIAKLPTGGIKLNDQMDIPREAMLGLRPDFVLATYGGGFDGSRGFATREDLGAIGANTYVPAKMCGTGGKQTVEDSYEMIRDLGRIYGVSDRAERLIEDSRRRIAQVEARVKDKQKPRVMLIIPGMDMGAGDFSSVGAQGIWNDIIARAGGVNAFADSAPQLFANLSKEQLAAAQLDAVIIVNYQNPDPNASATKLYDQFPQWAAAKAKRHVVLSDSIYFGPNNATAVERIAALLHPAQ
ncbi:ABC transporter substrate-binding protein [Allokutzneria albata]|uniref:Iron complex transport system substrate-binding protein n=1 Tax=Allokutzneria albata TaxID=211114 RepID=A0A1G9VAT3_ALLAB|nr:ABC transporter substrate-binding protein [Allokutzneria albata]SDM69166.1 iron complex transport system substrate-binding protein [Allokutzneria albata]